METLQNKKLQSELEELSEITGLTTEVLNVIKTTVLFVEGVDLRMSEESKKAWETFTLKEKVKLISSSIPIKEKDTRKTFNKGTDQKLSHIGLDEVQTYKDIAEFQNEYDEIVFFIDIDNNFNSEKAIKYGVNIDNLMVTKTQTKEPLTLDMVLDITDNLVASRGIENIYIGFKLHVKGYHEGFGDENIVDISGANGANIRRLDLDMYDLKSFLRNSLTS